ncbi:hypothetical protein GCK72_004434 [Caenorhabditis remanei]|uniref:Tyrosine-protein phosphatase domain-containing protein n=1 Tax=Caenorhabditis remanei TaxID=31234 RepID=A0A6A5HCD5_CAERE|nr:hypothetical protein GCK72_004434 [Caenorhabditis remanei]KAF1764486.1 hypothetical protein GCK72_004434 [Caenorhabditis remanei]
MKIKTWIFLISAISAQSLPRGKEPPEINSLENGGWNYSTDAPHRTSAAVSFRRRFNRDVNDANLETHVSNLKMVARITNGMSILAKSMHHSLEVEQFISEVLRFGDITPTQIDALDGAKLNEFLNNLKTLPDDVMPTAAASKDIVEKVEKVFDGLKKILVEVDGVGDIREWKEEKDHFLKEIERLGKDGVPLAPINTIHAVNGNWADQSPELLKNDSKSTRDDLKGIRDLFSRLKTKSQSFDADTKFWSFANFTNAVDGISPVLKAAEGVEVYDKVFKTIKMDEKDENDYVEYLKLVVSKLKGPLARMDYVKIVSELLTSRAKKVHQRRLRDTFGLSNGAADFASLSTDVENPWIQKVIKTKSLKTSFSHFDRISELFTNIEQTFKGDLEGFKKMLHFLDSIPQILAKVGLTKADIHQARNCNRPVADDIKTDLFTPFYQSLETIDDKLSGLKNETQKLSTLLKTPGIAEMCDEVIAICNELKDDDSNLKDVLKKFREYPKMKNLTAHITELKKVTSDISSKQLDSYKTETANVVNNMKSLNDYQNRIGEYATYFKCLQDQDKLKSVFKALDGLNEIRGWSQNTDYSKALSDGSGVMNGVIGVKGYLSELKKSVESLEQLDSPEAKMLKEFSSASTHSENIGKAVQALDGMRLALKNQAGIQKVVDNIPVVSSHKAQLTDTVDVANLEKLVGSSSEIEVMLTSLGTFKKTVVPFVSTDTFAAQSEIFENGKKVTGVTGGFSVMSEAVGKLKKTVKGQDASKLNDVEDGLNTMDSLNLDFASFKTDLDASKKSLAELDLFFASNFKASKVTLSPGNTPSGNQANPTTLGGQQVWATTGVDEKKELNVDLLVGIAAGFLVLLLLVILIHGLLHKYKRRWLVDHYCIKWKATPEILFDIYYEYFKRKFDALRLDETNLKGHMDAVVFKYFTSAYETDKCDAIDFKKKDAIDSDCRYPTELWAENAPVLKGYDDRFENNFFHANMCSFYTRKEWMLTEAPQMKSADKNCTISKMFWMAKQNKTQSIVMLCDLKEKDKPVCDRYYPETPESEALTFGDLTVRCHQMTKPCKGLEIRLLFAKFGDEEEFSVAHYKFTGLKITGFPKSMAGLMQVYNALERDTQSPIIHCSKDNRRTGLFTFGAMLYDDFKKTQKVNLKTNLIKIRKLRVGSVPNAEDYSYGARICWEMLASKVKLDDLRKQKYEAYKAMELFAEGGTTYYRLMKTPGDQN